MRLSEMKRDMGINYDGDAAKAELQDMYGSQEFELVDKVMRSRLENIKEVQKMLRVLKATHSPFSATNKTATSQLLTLYENIIKTEVKDISDIWRQKKHETS